MPYIHEEILIRKHKTTMSPEHFKMITADLMSKKRIWSVLAIILFFGILAVVAYVF